MELGGTNTRRRFLGAVGGAMCFTLSAGCTGFQDGSNDSNATAPGKKARFWMEATPVFELPARVLRRLSKSDDDYRVLKQGREGSIQVTRPEPPLGDGRHYIFEDAVWEVEYDILDRQESNEFQVRLGIVEGDVSPDETIQYDNLPKVDKRCFEEMNLQDGEMIGIRTSFTYSHTDLQESVLVPEAEVSFIVWDTGKKAEWSVTGRDTITLKTYLYSSELVASTEEYGQRMQDLFAWKLSGLSQKEHEIVETATEDFEYVIEPDESPSKAFSRLARRFIGKPQACALYESRPCETAYYIVRYEGSTYWTSLIFSGDTVEETEMINSSSNRGS